MPSPPPARPAPAERAIHPVLAAGLPVRMSRPEIARP
jgi:hypothetical protein